MDNYIKYTILLAHIMPIQGALLLLSSPAVTDDDDDE